MAIKIVVLIALISGLRFLYGSFYKSKLTPEPPIDKVWWDGLTSEWRTILLINQNFKKQHVDVYKVQEAYINRMNKPGEERYSEMNKSLHGLNEIRKFELSYNDLYARAIRENYLTKNDSIELPTLIDLDTLYMVSGPGDLTPLKKLPNLRVLIANYCGTGNDVQLSKQMLDLEPLKYLSNLKVLHCSSPALKSLEPVRDLVDLEELRCDNSGVTTLAPLKKLTKLKKLSIGSEVKNAEPISYLNNLNELYISGCKKVPNLSRLSKLKKLSIAEGEMSLVNGSYRVKSIEFLKDLTALEFLDLEYTSYKGQLTSLYNLQKLKAIALPPVSSSEMASFKQRNQECKILNAHAFQR